MEQVEPSASAGERLGWRITPEGYEQIRGLWIAHSKAEDARDIAGLIDTLSDDCVYELVPTGAGGKGTRALGPSTRACFGPFPTSGSPYGTS